MTFTVDDFNDLKLLLAQHPDWGDELRHLLMKQDLDALPGIVRELAETQRSIELQIQQLAEAQRRTETRVEELVEAQRRTEARVEELVEAQRRTEARVEELAEAQRRTEARVEELVEAQRRTEARVEQLEVRFEQLAEAQRQTELRLSRLIEVVQLIDERLTRLEHRVEKMDIRLARVDGRTLEMEYREKATSYFGRWIRRGEVVRSGDVWELLEDRLDGEELQEVLRLDLVVRGRLMRKPDRPEVWLAVEVSAVLDQHDVVRAEHRAGLLRRAGLVAIPVVAGANASDDALTAAKTRNVAMLQDGSGLYWDEALAAWA